jgi:hypothetical protein
VRRTLRKARLTEKITMRERLAIPGQKAANAPKGIFAKNPNLKIY